jgi:hypothetical protein
MPGKNRGWVVHSFALIAKEWTAKPALNQPQEWGFDLGMTPTAKAVKLSD